MAGADTFRIVVSGRQSHGSRPWAGVDPIVAASQIVIGLQTIVSRQIDITELPAVVTVGKIDGGVRTEHHSGLGRDARHHSDVRSESAHRHHRANEAHRRGIAASSGAKATLTMSDATYPPVMNNPQLTERMLPSLRSVAGANRVITVPLQTGAEDFAYFANEIPDSSSMSGLRRRRRI